MQKCGTTILNSLGVFGAVRSHAYFFIHNRFSHNILSDTWWIWGHFLLVNDERGGSIFAYSLYKGILFLKMLIN